MRVKKSCDITDAEIAIIKAMCEERSEIEIVNEIYNLTGRIRSSVTINNYIRNTLGIVKKKFFKFKRNDQNKYLEGLKNTPLYKNIIKKLETEKEIKIKRCEILNNDIITLECNELIKIRYTENYAIISK